MGFMGTSVFEAMHETSTMYIDTLGHGMKWLQLRAFIIPSGTVEALLRFNDDRSTSYERRQSSNGGADTTTVSATSIDLNAGTFTEPIQFDIWIYNRIGNDKLVIMQKVGRGTAGAGNAPNRIEQISKFVIQTAQITRIDIINTQAGEYMMGSRLVVIGSG